MSKTYAVLNVIKKRKETARKETAQEGVQKTYNTQNTLGDSTLATYKAVFQSRLNESGEGSLRNIRA